jgi:hypothetical protein
MISDYYEDLANEMGNTDRYIQPDEEEEMPDTPSRSEQERGYRMNQSAYGLPVWMIEAVDIGEHRWSQGNCHEYGCGCVTEYIKIALAEAINAGGKL